MHDGTVDLVAGYESFVSVSRRGSFTNGAIECGILQSVASRRIANLENCLGGQLFDRTSRRVELTQLGRDLLPSASALVSLSRGLRDQAHQFVHRPMTFAMPTAAAIRDLAQLTVAANLAEIPLNIETADPLVRSDWIRTGRAELSVQPVPASDATWKVELGLASRNPIEGSSTIFLESIRRRRGQSASRARRLWIQTEDDTPHIRDRVTLLGNSVSLLPTQIEIAPQLVRAVTSVLQHGDLLLASRNEATQLGLHWYEIGEIRLIRGYSLNSHSGERDAVLVEACGDLIATALGGRSK